jgi:sigma-B regulation protein RsbU (phosphoserine phosphatase)
VGSSTRTLEAAAAAALPIVAQLLGAERSIAAVCEELAGRYEEIDLLYAISDILGHTVHLEEAAQTIITIVADLMRAERASIMVCDEAAGVLRTVASRGFSHRGHDPVSVNDPESVAALAWRENRIVGYDASVAQLLSRTHPSRSYHGEAFLSVPICYAAPGTSSRCIGVINLTDRSGTDFFSASEQKLISAVANQVGAALENSRLVERDILQQRIHRELELARDLQFKLLPSPSVLQGDAEVAAHMSPAETVGGDFYTFNRLGAGRVGVMLGDVSSHGFAAALIMAQVMAAAGIHSGLEHSPDETLIALHESLFSELASTEMHFSVFYGVLDPGRKRLAYSNAGHHHAFRIPRSGPPERLDSTSPPLGLTGTSAIARRDVPWEPGSDLLCLWTDGLVDARDGSEAFTEAGLLDAIGLRRSEPPAAIVDAIFREADLISRPPVDDRTLLILRI